MHHIYTPNPPTHTLNAHTLNNKHARMYATQTYTKYTHTHPHTHTHILNTHTHTHTQKSRVNTNISS